MIKLDDFDCGGRAYLNNASVSVTPGRAVRAAADFQTEYGRAGPDSRRGREMAREALGNVRRVIAGIINAEPDEIVLTQSVTDGVNIVAGGLDIREGSSVVIRGGEHEHHSNLYPWLKLGRRCRLRTLGIDAHGFYDGAELEEALEGASLLSLSHGLYNTGAILPVEEAGRLAAERGVPYFVDAAQTVGCMEVDVKKIGCDFMSFNGSKWLCGPMGTGIFYCRRGSEDLLEPQGIGGESARLEGGRLEYKAMPDRFQTGFRNYGGMAALASSASLLSECGIGAVREHVSKLAGIMREQLAGLPGATVYGPEDPELRTSIVPFAVEGLDPETAVARLEEQGLILAVREIYDKKIIRAAPHVFNTEEQVSGAVDALRNLS